MAIVTLPSFGSDPVTITGPGLDAKVDPLATDYNGNIDNDNIKSAAGIVYSKLTLTNSVVNADIYSAAAIADTKLATLTTAGKVNFSALVVGSQATGDIAYASSSSVWTRLAAGTTSQVLIGGASAPSWGALPAAAQPSGSVVQTIKTTYATYASLGTTAIVLDDSAVTWAEGNEVTGLATTITPSSNSNYLIIDAIAHISKSSNNGAAIGIALFQDPSGTDASLAFESYYVLNVLDTTTTALRLRFIKTSPGTSSTTFKFRIGSDSSNTLVINGKAAATAGRIFGGTLISSVVIREIKA